MQGAHGSPYLCLGWAKCLPVGGHAPVMPRATPYKVLPYAFFGHFPAPIDADFVPHGPVLGVCSKFGFKCDPNGPCERAKEEPIGGLKDARRVRTDSFGSWPDRFERQLVLQV